MLRIFLVGSPRSGTTLYQRLVAGHPSLTTFPESHFFHHLCGESRLRRVFRLARSGAVRRRLVSFLEECGEPRYRERVAACTARSFGGWTELYVEILDDIAKSRGAEGWVEKTPMHLHYVHLIERYVDDPRLLHIVRPGEEVVASVRRVTTSHPEAWGGERSVEECVDRWLFDVEQHRKHVGAPGHSFVLYEELVRDPARALRDTCDFLGLSFSESMLGSGPRDGIIRPDEPWKEASRRSVSPDERRSAEEALDESELRYVRERTRSVDLSIFA